MSKYKNIKSIIKECSSGIFDRSKTPNQYKKQPGFLIAGTMKGGTSALYNFIVRHPDVRKASRKEIHYFTLNYRKGHEWYLAHFNHKPYKVTGEASPTYFDLADSLLIPTRIKQFNPSVKVLLIIRDPIERAISQFIHLRKVNKIHELQSMNINEFFTIPLSAPMTETTVAGSTIAEYYLRQVISFSMYYRKYLLYKSVFDSSSLLVITNKSLKEAPFETMGAVYNFIGVKPIHLRAFRKHSSTGTNINMLNQHTLDRLAEMLYPDYRNFCNASGIEYSEVNLCPKHLIISGRDHFLITPMGLLRRLVQFFTKGT